MDVTALLQAVSQHKWIVVAALVITAIVRLLKSDAPLPITVPARWRAWVALGLGVVAGVLNAVISGTAWQTAVLQGLAAAITAILGHELVIEGLRGGKELISFSSAPTGGSGSAGGGAPPSKPTSVRPPGMTMSALPLTTRVVLVAAVLGAAIAACLPISGCKAFQGKPATLTADGASVAACILSHYDDLANAPDLLVAAEQVALECGASEKQLVVDIFSAQRKAAMKHAAAASSAAPCASGSAK